jgi:hypothetical protein
MPHSVILSGILGLNLIVLVKKGRCLSGKSNILQKEMLKYLRMKDFFMASVSK